MKSIFLVVFALFSFSNFSFSQETKVYIKSNQELGRFYAYVDGKLMNRSPQIQVGVLGLEEKPSYHLRVVFQNPEKMPIEGDIKPKLNRTKLFVLYAGTSNEVKARKGDKALKEAPIPGDIMPSHHSLPDYKGRLGCDEPMDNHLLNQIISQMTSSSPLTPLEIAKKEVTVMCFTTKQFSEILAALPDDAERVELSKTAWYFLYDQENFSKLENAFTEPGQVQQVLNYVQRNQ
ncbi:MAG: DUF4476 domain-containing protein [Salibacteraceae bacterium]